MHFARAPIGPIPAGITSWLSSWNWGSLVEIAVLAIPTSYARCPGFTDIPVRSGVRGYGNTNY
jgi:hypothetical protein